MQFHMVTTSAEYERICCLYDDMITIVFNLHLITYGTYVMYM